MNKTLKRYIVSSLVTFAAAFLFVIYMQIDDITLKSFGDGTVVGILFAAVRAGVKAAIELFLVKRGLVK